MNRTHYVVAAILLLAPVARAQGTQRWFASGMIAGTSINWGPYPSLEACDHDKGERVAAYEMMAKEDEDNSVKPGNGSLASYFIKDAMQWRQVASLVQGGVVCQTK